MLSHEITFRYLQSRLGLNAVYNGSEFILYKIEDDLLCVHDLYSENTEKGSIYKMLTDLVDMAKKEGCTHAETYLDKYGNFKERTEHLINKFGFEFDKDTFDYVYYRKEI